MPPQGYRGSVLTKRPIRRRGLGSINWFPGLAGAEPGSVGTALLGSIPQYASPNAAPPGGGSPYAGLLQDYLNQSRADFAAESTADKGSMINAIRRYMISYGSSPNFDAMGGLGKDAQGYLKQALDAKTLGLMKKNEEEGLSARARMQQANDVAVRRIPATLASRGILRSGQTGSDLADQAMEYKRTGYDMLNELLSGITGSVSGFQEAERQRQRQLAQIEMDAAFQAAQDWADSYMGNEPEPSFALPTSPPRGSSRGRPPKPGPNYYWNGKRWVYRRPRSAGGGGGGRSAVL